MSFPPSQKMHTGPNFSNFNKGPNDGPWEIKVSQKKTCASTDDILLKRNSRSFQKI